ncbi:MAG: hypothetical protein RMY16_05465 [Nostoc sp. DedQUE12b]|uniref:hypothetical protein n=1 Tax=unclassified Nostoc TaxID=2593658 RepID=UPI002AD216D1|nr:MULTISPECIES: hypothetical protein [unclassified Nostoc]MDZ7949901.1 hypothetical protein [Nostoc sp. DedQUE09]MDZ8085036.1 hypothetical protein [Nostoc sp. DedQUE12b]
MPPDWAVPTVVEIPLPLRNSKRSLAVKFIFPLSPELVTAAINPWLSSIVEP